MLSHGKAGTEPGRWAYATLPKHLILKHPFLPRQGPWSLLWSLEVRATLQLVRQADAAQALEDAIAVGARERRQVVPHFGQRQVGIALTQSDEAALGLASVAAQQMRRAERAMNPYRRGMLEQGALLPARRLGIAAGLEMRAADADHAVEGERILRRDVARDLEAFDRPTDIALVKLDPALATPGPGRAAIHRQRLANHQLCPIEVTQQREGVAQYGKRARLVCHGLRLARQVGRAGTLRLRL